MKNREKCLLCHGTNYGIFFEGGKDWEYGITGTFSFKKCHNCGLISLHPLPSQKKLTGYYPPSYHCYNSPSSAVTRVLAYLSLKKQAELFKKLIGQKGEILDVGSSDGKQFDTLKKFGQWHFSGIDINSKMIKNGKLKGRDLYLTTIEKFKTKTDSFDLIIMDHLLEHVIDPDSTIKAACSLLKKGGYLIGATPNVRSLDAFLWRKYWGGNHFPRHTYLFFNRTLKALFEKNGMKLKNINYEYHTGHWALSIQNFFQDNRFSKVSLKKGRAFYYPVLLLLFLPINIFQNIFHCTGVISFVAVKS